MIADGIGDGIGDVFTHETQDVLFGGFVHVHSLYCGDSILLSPHPALSLRDRG